MSETPDDGSEEAVKFSPRLMMMTERKKFGDERHTCGRRFQRTTDQVCVNLMFGHREIQSHCLNTVIPDAVKEKKVKIIVK